MPIYQNWLNITGVPGCLVEIEPNFSLFKNIIVECKTLEQPF